MKEKVLSQLHKAVYEEINFIIKLNDGEYMDEISAVKTISKIMDALENIYKPIIDKLDYENFSMLGELVDEYCDENSITLDEFICCQHITKALVERITQ